MTPRELESLIQRFVDGRLDNDSCEELVALLKEDPEALKTYCQYAELDAGLEYLSSGSVAQSFNPGTKRISRMVRERQSRRTRGIALISSAVAVTVLLLTLSTIWLKSPDGPPATFTLGPDTGFTVTHPQGTGNIAPTSLQLGSSIELTRGTLEIQIETGARAILEAPALVTLEEENRLHLSYGTVWCEVPSEAIGFQVKTPSLTATDLGTQFAVLSFPDQHEEVHVFQGRVDVTSPSNKNPIPLAAGDALSIDEHQKITRKTADPSEFLTSLPQKREHLHWAFDENDAGAQTVTGRIPGQDPVRSRCATRDGEEPFASFSVVNGRFGYGLSSFGRNGLIKTNSPGFPKDKPFTLSYWIKINPGQHSPYSLVSWGSAESRKAPLFSSEIRKTARGSVTAVTIGAIDLEGSQSLDDGRWHHLVLRHNPNRDADSPVECFLDGEIEPLRESQNASHLLSTSADSPAKSGPNLTLLAHPRVEAETGKQVKLSLVREKGITTTYLNGGKIGVSKESPPIFETPSHLMIGANLDGSGELEGFFTGTIDHLRLSTFTGSLAASELLGSEGPSVQVVAEYSFDDHTTPTGFQVIGDPQYQNGRLVLDGDDALMLQQTPLTATDNFIMEVRCTMTSYPTNARRFAFPVSNGNGVNRGWGILYHHTWGGIVMGEGPVGSATIDENTIPVAIDELHLFDEVLRPSEIRNLFQHNQTARQQPERSPNK